MRPREGCFRLVPLAIPYNCGVPTTAIRVVMTPISGKKIGQKHVLNKKN